MTISYNVKKTMSKNSSASSQDEYNLNLLFRKPEIPSVRTSFSGDSDFSSGSRRTITTPSTFRSNRSKFVKMVHGLDEAVCDVNEVYVQQLQQIKKRVSLLDIHESGSEKSIPLWNSSANSSIRSFSNLRNSEDDVEEIGEESESPIVEITPRMVEVPPKKKCIRDHTPVITSCTEVQPLIHENSNAKVKYKSIWTDITIKNEDDEDWDVGSREEERILIEDLPKPSQSGDNLKHIEPNVIVINKTQSLSSTSLQRRQSVTLSGPTGSKLESRNYKISLTDSSESVDSLKLPPQTEYFNDHFKDYTKGEPNILKTKSYDIIKLENEGPIRPHTFDMQEISKKYVTGPKISLKYKTQPSNKDYLHNFCTPPPKQKKNNSSTVTVAPFSSTTKALSSGIKRLLNVRKSKKCSNISSSPPKEKSLEDEDLEYFPDEVVMRLINYSDYDLPLKNVKELPDLKNTRDIVTNLAAEVFKPIDEITKSIKKSSNEIKDCNSSFKDVIQEINEEYEGSAIKKRTSFKNLFSERRQQATHMDYYNVEKLDKLDEVTEEKTEDGKVTQINLNDNESTKGGIIIEDDIEGDELNNGCCSLEGCLEFMFPKRQERYF